MRKVLIVHNPGPFTDILSDHLRGNYKVTVCHTGTNAITLIDRIHPDILILYLSLPDIDGITVLHCASYMPDVILALTNLATESVLQAAFDAGTQDVIMIPAPIHYIVSRIEQLIKKAPSLEA